MEAFRAGRYAEAEERFTEIAARGGDNGPSAALFAAQAARSSSGCSSAGGRFDEVHTRYRGTSVGNEAAWQAAVCYSALGQTERARKNYEAVLNADGYGERAAKAIASLDRQASPEAASGANAAVEARAKASATAPKTEAQKTGTSKNAAPVQTKPPAEKKAASEDTRQAEPDAPALSQ
jgi:tetratricopeptide (TPR) repeat protein